MIDIALIQRTIMSMIQIGTIAEVQAQPLRYRVQFDELRKSWWLRHGVDRASSSASDWNPFEIGEQVLCLLPGGNWDGVIICAIYSEKNPQPESDLKKFVKIMKDGARIEYDNTAHLLKATLPDDGKVELIAKGGVKIDGPLDVTENITSEKDIQDKTSTMQTLRDTYNSHKHGDSPLPAPTMQGDS